MADKSTVTNELKLLAAFADEDDRTISVRNPKANIVAAEIHQLAELALPVLIGDKYGAAFTRFKSANYVRREVMELDPNTFQAS